MDPEETKEAILHFIENVDDKSLEKLWKLIYKNFEVVATEEDIKAFQRARKEIEYGEFRRL